MSNLYKNIERLAMAVATKKAHEPAPALLEKEESGATSCCSNASSECALDRRIVRTNRALRRALIELIEEQGLATVTVGELCERADLNRGTFYNHYNSIDQLVVALEDEILDELVRFERDLKALSLLDLAKCKITGKPFPFLIEFFDYLREQSDFLHAILGAGGDARFATRLKDSIFVKFMHAILHERYRENPTPFVNYYIAFYAHAYLGAIEHWVETGMRESSEEMGRIALRLLFIQPGEAIEL